MRSDARLRPAPGVLCRAIRGVVIVLDGRTGRYYELDRSAASIWQLLDGRRTVDDVVTALASRQNRTASATADVRAFLESAAGDGLLTTAEPPIAHEASGDAPVLQLRASGLSMTGDVEALRDAFLRDHHVRLPAFVEPSLLREVLTQVERGRFAERAHGHIGIEQCLAPGTATAMLQLVFNDPALLDVMSSIAGCGRLGNFDGRVYRMAAAAGHYDSWHSDAGKHRQIAVSVNLSVEPYEGGKLEIRPATAAAATHTVANPGLGSAVMFRIAPDLRHRVSSVTGTRPRTAWAGWFRTVPEFADLFLDSLSNQRV